MSSTSHHPPPPSLPQPHPTNPTRPQHTLPIRGRSTNPYTNAQNHVQIPDQSLGHQKSPQRNLLNLNLTPSKQFHAIINAAGGIATAQANFDNDGLCHLTAGVSFSIFQKFQTFAKAFQYTKHFYPHIKT
jgi:hypothetical protein